MGVCSYLWPVIIYFFYATFLFHRFLEWYCRGSIDSLSTRDATLFCRIINGCPSQFGRRVWSSTSVDQCSGRCCRSTLLTLRRSSRCWIFQLRSCRRRRRWSFIPASGWIPDGRTVFQRRHRWWVICPITWSFLVFPSHLSYPTSPSSYFIISGTWMLSFALIFLSSPFNYSFLSYTKSEFRAWCPSSPTVSSISASLFLFPSFLYLWLGRIGEI